MLRALSVFLLVFLFLSIIVHLAQMAIVFGVVAFGLTAVDLAIARFQKSERPGRLRRGVPVLDLLDGRRSRPTSRLG